MAKKICCVFGCLNTNVNKPQLSFFTLPAEPNRRALWLQLISREELQDKNAHSHVVCEEHFSPVLIQGSPERKILKRYCTPSLKLPQKKFVAMETQTEIKEIFNKFAQTEFYTLKLNSSTQTPNYLTTSLSCVKKLKEELKAYKKLVKSAEARNMNKDSFHKLCDKFLTKPLAEIVKAQTKLKVHGKGNRYPLKYKQFCIHLYYTSPQAYKLLEQALCLPNSKTLAKHSLPISTEVNEHLMTTLKVKVNNMSNKEKVCSVLVDVINLKLSLFYNIGLDKIIGFQEVNGVQTAVLANNALVVMTRGIYGNWKQPIGFALLGECRNSEEISIWIEQLLEKLIDCGLDIRTFVTDFEADFLRVGQMSTITVDKPYFFIKNKKIYYIADALHLMRSLRNNLMSNDFHFQGSVAKYEHILQFYESDKNKSLRLAPKLTESHVKPTKFEKTNVQYAIELLSNTVATAISCYIDFQAISESAKETVKFIKLINDLFDVFNSSTVHSTCEYQQAFSGSAEQITFMKDMLDFFKSLSIVNSATGRDVTSTAKFINGYQITITSILLLFDDLRVEGHNYLLTRRLNLDVIDLFFRQIQSSYRKTTIRQFILAFRKIFFSNIIKSGKQGSRSDVLSQLLTNTEKLALMSVTDRDNMIVPEDGHNETNQDSNTPAITSTDYNNIELPENNGMRYISGYLLKKCIDVHKECQLFKAYVYPNDNTQVIEMEIEGATDKVEINNGRNIITPEDFLNFVEEMEKHYQDIFINYNKCTRVAKCLFDSMDVIVYHPPCNCFPINYVKKLFIRIRIYITVKYNNEDFKKHRSGKKTFSVINL